MCVPAFGCGPPSPNKREQGAEGEQNQPPGVNPSVAQGISLYNMSGGAEEIRLDRFFVDTDPGVSFFVALHTMDRFQVSPGTVLASRFISSLDFGPITVLY